MCNALPDKNGDVTDANVACWLQKASKSHKVLEINTVEGTPEREVQRDVEMYLKKRRRSQEAVWQFMSQKNEDNALDNNKKCKRETIIRSSHACKNIPHANLYSLKLQIYSGGRKTSWLVKVSDEGVWGRKPN